ncbi:MAG: hypothetical protein EBU88_05970 [Acidobacteria bacterium]|nr:hypothetical protein [Acidobacteriota bacterium]
MGMTVEMIEYRGWKQALRLTNGLVELVVPLEIGPRVMRFSFVNGNNVFKEYENQLGRSGEKEWQIRGGHRLWHAPEDDIRTYEPDNGAIRHEMLGDSGVRLIQPVEGRTGVEKELDLHLDKNGSGVLVVHRLRNRNIWEIELAPWCLSVMAPGGTAIVPLPGKISHPGSVQPGEVRDLRGFVPNQNLILWPFTNLADARYRWGTKYITLRQDREVTSPTKIGLAHQMRWVGYLNQGLLFIKEIGFENGRHYPDGGSNFETFTNGEMLEIESLGPLSRLAPGSVIEHTERWWLVSDLPSETTDEALERHVRPRVEALLNKQPIDGVK